MWETSDLGLVRGKSGTGHVDKMGRVSSIRGSGSLPGRPM